MHSRDPRREAIDIVAESEPYRAEPGEGARQAQRAAGIERDERTGVAPPTGAVQRLIRRLRSLFTRS